MCVAPRTQRCRPLRSSGHVVQRHALEDHRGVDDPGRDRSDLPTDDGDHHLVEPGGARRRVARRDQGLAVSEHAERPQISIAEPRSELGRAHRQVRGRRRVALAQRSEERRNEAVTGSGALTVLRDEPVSTGQPAVRLGHPALQQEDEREPAGAPRRARDLPGSEGTTVRRLPCADTDICLPDQVRRHRQTFEIGGVQRLLVARREDGEQLVPGLSGERCLAPLARRLHDAQSAPTVPGGGTRLFAVPCSCTRSRHLGAIPRTCLLGAFSDPGRPWAAPRSGGVSGWSGGP